MKNSISKYLAANIIQLRAKKNLSQKQLAQLCEIPRTTITNMESGSGNPSLSNLDKLSKALKISIESLLSRPRNNCTLIKSDFVTEVKKSNGKISMFKLLPDKIRGLEIDRIELAGNSTMGGLPHLQGTKEYLSVIQGEITIYVAGEAFIVSKNDVFAFPADQPHSYKNNKTTKSIAMSIVIPVPASI